PGGSAFVLSCGYAQACQAHPRARAATRPARVPRVHEPHRAQGRARQRRAAADEPHPQAAVDHCTPGGHRALDEESQGDGRPRDGYEPRFWNIWWTLTLISAALTILAGVLEILGVWHDIGLGVSVIGLACTIVFGAASATKTAVIGIDRRLDQLHDILSHSLK